MQLGGYGREKYRRLTLVYLGSSSMALLASDSA